LLQVAGIMVGTERFELSTDGLREEK